MKKVTPLDVLVATDREGSNGELCNGYSETFHFRGAMHSSYGRRFHAPDVPAKVLEEHRMRWKERGRTILPQDGNHAEGKGAFLSAYKCDHGYVVEVSLWGYGKAREDDRSAMMLVQERVNKFKAVLPQKDS